MLRLVRFCFALTIAPSLFAQDLVIEGGRRFDVVSGGLVENQNLVIRDGKIVAIDAKVERSTTTVVIDATGKTILPGLFDLHVHVGVPGGSMTSFVGVDAADNLSSHLACGVTTVIDLHGDIGSIFALRDRARTSPWMARLLTVGGAFTAPGGHGSQFGIPANLVTTNDDIEPCFEALLPHAPDAVKVILEHGAWLESLPKLPTLDDALVAEVVRQAHAAKLPALAHVWTLAEAKSAVRGGADALVHGVFTEPVDDELISLMRQNGTAYVPTLAVVMGPRRIAAGADPYGHELADDALPPAVLAAVRSENEMSWAAGFEVEGGDALWLANLKRMHDAGIVLGTGSDAGNPLTPHGPSLLFELELFVEAGVPPAAALRAATLDAARILRREASSGSLEVGKLGDALIVDGDPLADIAVLRDIAFVVKDGVVVDRERLFARIDDPSLARDFIRLDTPTIDDFDDGDFACPHGGTWSAMNDAMARGDSRAELVIESGALRVHGTLGTTSPYGAFAGVSIAFDPGGKRCLDFAGYDGFEIRLKGVPRAINLVMQRAAVKDFNVFAARLPLTEEWATVRIPFTEVRQIGFGKPVEFGVSDVNGITIEARNAPGAKGGAFEFEIDSIGLYREG